MRAKLVSTTGCIADVLWGISRLGMEHVHVWCSDHLVRSYFLLARFFGFDWWMLRNVVP